MEQNIKEEIKIYPLMKCLKCGNHQEWGIACRDTGVPLRIDWKEAMCIHCRAVDKDQYVRLTSEMIQHFCGCAHSWERKERLLDGLIQHQCMLCDFSVYCIHYTPVIFSSKRRNHPSEEESIDTITDDELIDQCDEGKEEKEEGHMEKDDMKEEIEEDEGFELEDIVAFIDPEILNVDQLSEVILKRYSPEQIKTLQDKLIQCLQSSQI